MGFHFEEINSVSIELKKENDVLKEQLAEAKATTKTKKTTASKRNSKKKNS